MRALGQSVRFQGFQYSADNSRTVDPILHKFVSKCSEYGSPEKRRATMALNCVVFEPEKRRHFSVLAHLSTSARL